MKHEEPADRYPWSRPIVGTALQHARGMLEEERWAERSEHLRVRRWHAETAIAEFDALREWLDSEDGQAWRTRMAEMAAQAGPNLGWATRHGHPRTTLPDVQRSGDPE